MNNRRKKLYKSILELIGVLTLILLFLGAVYLITMTLPVIILVIALCMIIYAIGLKHGKRKR